MPGAGADVLESVHAALRKAAHVTEYAILAVLLFRALDREERPWPRTSVYAVLLCAAYAATDELHQSLVPSRTAALADVLLDTAGATAGVAFRRLWLSSDRRSRA